MRAAPLCLPLPRGLVLGGAVCSAAWARCSRVDSHGKSPAQAHGALQRLRRGARARQYRLCQGRCCFRLFACPPRAVACGERSLHTALFSRQVCCVQRGLVLLFCPPDLVRRCPLSPSPRLFQTRLRMSPLYAFSFVPRLALFSQILKPSVPSDRSASFKVGPLDELSLVGWCRVCLILFTTTLLCRIS